MMMMMMTPMLSNTGVSVYPSNSLTYQRRLSHYLTLTYYVIIIYLLSLKNTKRYAYT